MYTLKCLQVILLSQKSKPLRQSEEACCPVLHLPGINPVELAPFAYAMVAAASLGHSLSQLLMNYIN
jgi:hypothetical protein